MQHRKTTADATPLAAVTRFLAEVAGHDGDGGRAATAFGAHLRDLTAGRLPAGARESWRGIAHLLRAPAERQITDRIILAVRSWPQTRVAELTGLVHALHAILERSENDRLEDEIRDSIRRHYL
jgi:hypothetical protein